MNCMNSYLRVKFEPGLDRLWASLDFSLVSSPGSSVRHNPQCSLLLSGKCREDWVGGE